MPAKTLSIRLCSRNHVICIPIVEINLTQICDSRISRVASPIRAFRDGPRAFPSVQISTHAVEYSAACAVIMKDFNSPKRENENSSVPNRIGPVSTAIAVAGLAVLTATAAASSFTREGGVALRAAYLLLALASTAALTILIFGSWSRKTGSAGRKVLAELRSEIEDALGRAAKAESALENERSENEEFVSMLSHELRTPSNSLLGWSRILYAPGLDDDMRSKALAGIESSVEKQLSVIKQLSKLGDLNECSGLPLDDEVNFSGLIEDVVEEVRPGAEEASVSLDVVDDVGDLRIKCDRSSFRDALRELIRAAVSFAPRGSTIKLFARHRDRFVSVTVKNRPQSPGPGTGRRRVVRHGTKGTLTSGRYALPGLSLAISRKIAEMHGGSLSLSGPRADASAELDLRVPDTLFVR